VAWPKGLVAEPSWEQKLGYLLRDNLSTCAALLGLVGTFAFFLTVWFKVGRDPAKGNIIPRFSPPEGFSPAAVRYLMHLGFDQKTFAAAVVDLAVKGYLKIEENDDGEYTLRRIGKNDGSLDTGEARLASVLFRGGDVLQLTTTNHERISEARRALKESLGRQINDIYFRSNYPSFFLGLGLSLVTLAAVIFTSRSQEAIFALIWLSIWSIACVFLAAMVYRNWRGAGGPHRRFGKIFTALASTLFALPFFIGEVFGLGIFAMSVSAPATLAFAGLVFLNALFYYLLKAPTQEGRQVMDQVEGFKMYLSVAEQDRLNLLNPPEKTPELFEKYLPYALALNVENEWSEQFAEVLAQAQVDGQPYQPTWYHGSSWNRLGSSGFADSLGGAFAAAIASSATAPGSSSGSGGGGSSGGGGGGGGGSGW